MRVFVGFILLVLGILIVRGCLRDYRNDLGKSLADDLWDYLRGRTLAIVTGVFLTLLGAGVLAIAFAPGASFRFSLSFPFVTVTQPSTLPP
jgi:hypothetical protein